MTPLWTAFDIAAAVDGEVHGDFSASGVAFDSREIGAGDLFIALQGEATDGHRFLDRAFAAGAAGAGRADEAPVLDHDGVVISVVGAKTDAVLRSRGPRSSSCAWFPRVSTERPSRAPDARQSIHATEYR